jgi:hypothetical protein
MSPFEMRDPMSTQRQIPQINFINKPKRKSMRLLGCNPRKLGTNPRALGSNPRAKKDK